LGRLFRIVSVADKAPARPVASPAHSDHPLQQRLSRDDLCPLSAEADPLTSTGAYQRLGQQAYRPRRFPMMPGENQSMDRRSKLRRERERGDDIDIEVLFVLFEV
jgi:hypothetical protein